MIHIVDLPRSFASPDYHVRMELRRQAKKGAKVSYEHIPVNKVINLLVFKSINSNFKSLLSSRSALDTRSLAFQSRSSQFVRLWMWTNIRRRSEATPEDG